MMLGRRIAQSLRVPAQCVRTVKTAPVVSKKTPKYAGFKLEEAVRLTSAYSVANFDETIELCVKTTLDPRKPNQMIRGVATLPHGNGKAVKVAVFAKDKKAEEALAAGADFVGGQDLVDQILAGNHNFTRCMATPDMMPMVGKVARILGPRGLMPNPKLGTVTMNIAPAVEAAKLGEVEFKCDRNGLVIVAVGKSSFSREKIAANAETFMNRLNELRPSGARGNLVADVYMASTMGHGIKIDTTQAPFHYRS